MTVQLYDPIADIDNVQKTCQMLMKTPHYAKMGVDGIFAVVTKARSMNLNPLEALNGGMYPVNGKVEMQGQMMLSLIRQAGHSIQMDPKSTNTHVIMHGKRSDNGDGWTASFSVDDARRAGIYKENGPWGKYTQIMCMWRCVSILGRFLFCDVIKGCYVEGEVRDAPSFDQPVVIEEKKVEVIVEKITPEQVEEISFLLSECGEEYQQKFKRALQQVFNCECIKDIPAHEYARVKSGITKKLEEQTEKDKAELEEVSA